MDYTHFIACSPFPICAVTAMHNYFLFASARRAHFFVPIGSSFLFAELLYKSLKWHIFLHLCCLHSGCCRPARLVDLAFRKAVLYIRTPQKHFVIRSARNGECFLLLIKLHTYHEQLSIAATSPSFLFLMKIWFYQLS